MFYYCHRFLLLALFFLMIVACATVAPNPEHITTAKQFLHSWSAGEMFLANFQSQIESEAKTQPGMAELVRRVFVDITAEEVEDMIARIFARHVSQEYLAELAHFTESQTGNKFFRMSVTCGMKERSIDCNYNEMRKFNADELTEIIRFSKSGGYAALNQAMPAIKRDSAEEWKRLGEVRFHEYLNRHQEKIESGKSLSE